MSFSSRYPPFHVYFALFKIALHSLSCLTRALWWLTPTFLRCLFSFLSHFFCVHSLVPPAVEIPPRTLSADIRSVFEIRLNTRHPPEEKSTKDSLFTGRTREKGRTKEEGRERRGREREIRRKSRVEGKKKERQERKDRGRETQSRTNVARSYEGNALGMNKWHVIFIDLSFIHPQQDPSLRLPASVRYFDIDSHVKKKEVEKRTKRQAERRKRVED